MKNLDVLFIPEEIETEELTGKLVVVIDILRASSTIVTALVRRCSGFIPIFSPDQVEEKARQLGKGEVLLGGERDGRKIKGFNLGNSPREYKREMVKDKIIIFFTTNGVKALEMAKSASEIVIGSFLNLSAVANYCADYKGDILLVCAGREGQFSLEDSVCAGMLIDFLKEKFPAIYQETDANLTAQMLYKRFSRNILGMLRKSQHGQYLQKIGLEEDLIFCSQEDVFNIVPIFKDGMIK